MIYQDNKYQCTILAKRSLQHSVESFNNYKKDEHIKGQNRTNQKKQYFYGDRLTLVKYILHKDVHMAKVQSENDVKK